MAGKYSGRKVRIWFAGCAEYTQRRARLVTARVGYAGPALFCTGSILCARGATLSASVDYKAVLADLRAHLPPEAAGVRRGSLRWLEAEMTARGAGGAAVQNLDLMLGLS